MQCPPRPCRGVAARQNQETPENATHPVGRDVQNVLTRRRLRDGFRSRHAVHQHPQCCQLDLQNDDHAMVSMVKKSSQRPSKQQMLCVAHEAWMICGLDVNTHCRSGHAFQHGLQSSKFVLQVNPGWRDLPLRRPQTRCRRRLSGGLRQDHNCSPLALRREPLCSLAEE